MDKKTIETLTKIIDEVSGGIYQQYMYCDGEYEPNITAAKIHSFVEKSIKDQEGKDDEGQFQHNTIMTYCSIDDIYERIFEEALALIKD